MTSDSRSHSPTFTPQRVYKSSVDPLVLLVLGNHDYRGNVLAQLSLVLHSIDDRWLCLRSFILNAEIVDFFFVDTTQFQESHWREVAPRGTYISNLLKDLDAALKESTAPWKIVVDHCTMKSVLVIDAGNVIKHFHFTDNMEEDTDEEGNEEEEDDESENEYTNDEDASWKVRRAATNAYRRLLYHGRKCIQCCMQRYVDKEIVEYLVTRAQEVGRSASARSSFADAALVSGYHTFTGGKLDDVTVIVSIIQRTN